MSAEAVLRWAPYVAMVAVTGIYVVFGPIIGLLPVLILGPTLACGYGRVRRTLFAGLLAFVLAVLSAGYAGRIGTVPFDVTIIALVAVTVVGMYIARLRLERERELADVREIAETVQRVLLRPIPRRVRDLSIAVSYTSAFTTARIGGDLLEVLATPYGVRMLVGDVQGKGLEAVEKAAWVLGAFREAVFDERRLGGVSARLESTLSRQLGEEEFVTAVLAEVRPTGIVLLNHGHPPPLLLTGDGEVKPIEPPEEGLALGLTSLGWAPPRPQYVRFVPGDQILFYTDGVIEARDRNGEFYPLAERAGLLRGDEQPQAALDRLKDDLLAHVGGPLLDDAAMLLLRRRAHPHH